MRPTLLRSSSLVLFLLLSLSLAAMAQSRKGADKGTLTKETFMDMESVSNPAISPDGRLIATGGREEGLTLWRVVARDDAP